MLKAWLAQTRDVTRLHETGACDARADRARGKLLARREKEKKGKCCDTWHVLIGCLDFYLLNNLDSIISMQILFYFIPKFVIFFSTNRDLDHLI